jgi:hypothetical protein
MNVTAPPSPAGPSPPHILLRHLPLLQRFPEGTVRLYRQAFYPVGLRALATSSD